MQETVENFDFDEFYRKADNELNPLKFPVMGNTQKHQQLYEHVELMHDSCIQVTKHIDEHRALNLVCAFYLGTQDGANIVNPAMILRFDCRQINDLITYRSGKEQREHMLVVACNDGYMRVFSTLKQ